MLFYYLNHTYLVRKSFPGPSVAQVHDWGPITMSCHRKRFTKRIKAYLMGIGFIETNSVMFLRVGMGSSIAFEDPENTATRNTLVNCACHGRDSLMKTATNTLRNLCGSHEVLLLNKHHYGMCYNHSYRISVCCHRYYNDRPFFHEYATQCDICWRKYIKVRMKRAFMHTPQSQSGCQHGVTLVEKWKWLDH